MSEKELQLFVSKINDFQEGGTAIRIVDDGSEYKIFVYDEVVTVHKYFCGQKIGAWMYTLNEITT